MNHHNKLFDLINALKKHERKLITPSSKTDQWHLLYKHILTKYVIPKKTYDEEKIKKHFNKNNLNKPKTIVNNLTRIKTETIHKIFDRLFPTSISKPTKLHFELIEFWYERNCFHWMEKEINELEKVLENSEDFISKHHLLEWRKKLLYATNKQNFKNILQVNIEQFNFTNVLQVEIALQKIKSEIEFLIHQDARLQSDESKLKFNNLLKSKWLEIDLKDLSDNGKRYHHFIKSQEYKFNGDTEKAIKSCDQLIELSNLNTLLEQEKLQQSDIQNCKNGICHYLVVCDYLNKPKLYNEKLNLLNTLIDKVEDSNIYLKNTKWFLNLRFLMKSGKLEDIYPLEEKISENWEAFIQNLKSKRCIAYAYNLIASFWFLEDSTKVIKWLKHYSKIKRKNSKIRDLNNSISLLHFPIGYDNDDIKDFPELYKDIDNLRRILSEQQNLTEYSQIVIKYFKKLESTYSKENKIIILKSFLEDLNRMKLSQKPLGLFEMKCWIKSKIENQPKRNFIDS